MSILEELLQELCPNGVEIEELGKIAVCQKARNKAHITEIAYSITQRGLVPTSDYFGEKTKITSSDTSGYYLVYKGWFVYSPSRIDVGSINYLRADGPVIVSPLDVVFSVDTTVIRPGFLLMYLTSHSGMFQILGRRQGIEGTGRKTLPFSEFSKIKIPVPPIAVQDEILYTLGKFESLISELTAELTARKKQYEYYRDKLLTFDVLGGGASECVWRTLGDIAENLDSQRKPVTSNKRTSGSYPYYGASGIVDYVDGYIFEGDYLLISEDGANLLSRTMPIAFSISGQNWVNNHAHVLKFDCYETRRFVEFYINSIDLSSFISGGAQPKLNQKNLNRIPIPVPTFSEQRRIVTILDRFDSLCNDLTSGLPAEIEARQKQYEYYRDKLLTFKELTP